MASPQYVPNSLLEEMNELKLNHTNLSAELRETTEGLDSRIRMCREWEEYSSRITMERDDTLERLHLTEDQLNGATANAVTLRDILEKMSRLKREAEVGYGEAVKTIKALQRELKSLEADVARRLAEQTKKISDEWRMQCVGIAKLDAHDRIMRYIGSILHHLYFNRMPMIA